MRNLKKVLALVLALAMALSVMASAFTAPEYTEEAQAEYDAMTAAQQNAFYVVSALGIVEGFSDGSFRPEENLTRAQFAAMVYRAKTGDVAKENTLFSSASVAMFSDAIDTWAIPYVAYAYSAGIVAGYPDGTFKATKAVTGLEAAKMLLTALGYDAEIEGLVGPTFYANTIKLGTAVGLFNGVKGDIYAPATRADAFVMFANALKANTVSYVGGVATPKTETLNSEDIITLGEEGFDLLDVEAILVATEDAALGAYWRNVITAGNAYGIEYENYQAAPAGYARFVYRDYVATNAANKGANYYDRVITVALGDQVAKFAELGEKYRLLVTDMSPVYNENEFRVLYGAPVATANDAYYAVKTSTVDDGKLAGIIDNMLKRAQAYNADATEETKDNTIFVNGAAVTFAEAKKAVVKSTAPYKAVDNDNDGTYDALFISKYTIGTVKAIDGTDVTVLGAGLGKITLDNAADLAVGDYVAVWSDTDGKYAKKLEVKESNVTGWDGANFTIDGESKTWGEFATTASKSLVGENANSLTETVYKFVFDGKYIVNVELTANTKYAKYAIVEAINGNAFTAPNYLGYPMVRLYTEDNEEILAYVKTVNGTLVQNYQLGAATDVVVGNLVSYQLDGDFVYIDTLAGNKVFDGNNASTDFEFVYNRATDTWEGQTVNGIIPFKDTYGVVFVSYDNGAPGSYRAYLDGEFMPNFYNADEAFVRDGEVKDTVIYVAQNGVNFIKAAKINFAHDFALPGLPITRANEELVIVKSTTVKVVDGKYIYTYTVYDANNNTTSTRESAPFAWTQAIPTENDVVVFYTNADGKVTSWTATTVNLADDFTGYWRDENVDAFELCAYTATGINLNPTNAIIALSDVVDAETGAQYVSYPINFSADADIWYFSIDGNNKVSQKSFYDINYDYNNSPVGNNYVVYVDLNETTQTAQRIIVIAGAKADALAQPTVTVKVTGSYDPNTKTVTYSIPKDVAGIPADLAELADGLIKDATKNADVYPWSDAYIARNVADVTFENVNGIWTVKSIKGIGDVVEYSAENGTQFADIYTGDTLFSVQGEENTILVKNGDMLRVWMYRENAASDRLDLLYQWDNAKAFTDKWSDLYTAANNNGVEYNSTASANNAYNYEKIIAVYDLDGNISDLVLVDTSADYEVANKFPYADYKDGNKEAVEDDDAKDPVQAPAFKF